MAEGYIKLYRCIADSDIYKMAPLYLRVFERLVLEANHQEVVIPFKESSTGKILIKRGEKLTSLSQIAEWVGWYERGIFRIPNKKTIKTILDWLVEQKMIESLGNGKVTHYFIINYNSYQDKQLDESNGKVTEGKRSLGTNKNEKNEKNEKKKNNKDTWFFTYGSKSYSLQGKRLIAFNQFWKAWNSDVGKSGGAYSWTKIPKLTNKLVEEICKGAEKYSIIREEIIQNNGKAKMAQGWLSDQRWKDKINTDESLTSGLDSWAEQYAKDHPEEARVEGE